MLPSRIRNTLVLLLSLFTLLVTVSVAATFWGIEQQRQDSLLVNLAGRQRVLAQQMARYSLEIQLGGNEAQLAQVLQLTMESFEKNQDVLHNGGEVPHLPGMMIRLPGTQNPDIQAQLDVVQQTWNGFKKALVAFQTISPASVGVNTALEQVQRLSQLLAHQTDEAVLLYEADSHQKIYWLKTIQAAFFVGAVILLFAGAWYTHRSVLQPLARLKASASRIGAGNLTTPVEVTGGEEVHMLAEAINTMRIQLDQSQEELRKWAGTLEKRVDQRTRELEALYQVSGEISSRLDVQHVLRTVAEKARELLGAQVASLCLLDPDQTGLILKAMSGPAVAVTGQTSSSSIGLAGGVLNHDGALQCATPGSHGGCGILSPAFLTSHLAAPLRINGGAIGALCVGSPEPGCFSPDDAVLLTRLSNSAAAALENARLYDQVERVAILEERQRIAAEMHDGLGQTLSYLGLELDQVGELVQNGQSTLALDRLEHSRQVIDQAVQEVREAIDNLLREMPGQRSLQEHLQGLVAEFNQEAKIQVDLESPRKKPLILSRPEVEQVLRAVREGLLNVEHHAPHSRATIVLESDECEARLAIRDDGPGFDPAKIPEDGKRHFGLRVMQARAARLGGKLEIHSAPGQGTQIVIRWPVPGSGS